MSANVLVSVIVPIYNVERYLDECMRSIRRQTYSNLQIIVIDDCSLDNSLKVLKSHLIDPRIVLIVHESNGGLSAARNTGIDAASGDYVIFVDSDDVISAHLVEYCVECVIQTGAELITYGFTPFKDGNLVQELLHTQADALKAIEAIDDDYFSLPHFAWLKFVSLKLLRKSVIRFPEKLYYEDWPFHWSLGLTAREKYQLKINLYCYRQREKSITSTTGKMLLDLFVVQDLVMNCVENARSPKLRKLLANKLLDSHWSVLTRIDKDLLKIAIEKAKIIEKNMRDKNYHADKNLRRCLIRVALKFPNNTSLFLANSIRFILRCRHWGQCSAKNFAL